MGNCFRKKSSSSSDIVPADIFKPSPPAIKLYGSSTCYLTSYIRFALSYKPISVRFAPSETPDFGSQTPVLQFGSELVSGSPLTLLRYLDSKFPVPVLAKRRISEMESPKVVTAVILQHRSMKWHLERLVRWEEDLVTRGGKKRGNPVVGSVRMEVKKFGKSYCQLLEVMLEHAQMEERILFPILERADRGLSKVANAEHARDLPIMNGINEDIKAIGVLDAANPDYQETLYTLSTRLKTLQDHCHEHFEEEEKELLPLMEAVDQNKEQQERLVEQCLEVMHETHSHLFQFFIEGLCPQDAMHYLDLVISCGDKQKISSMFSMILE